MNFNLFYKHLLSINFSFHIVFLNTRSCKAIFFGWIRCIWFFDIRWFCSSSKLIVNFNSFVASFLIMCLIYIWYMFIVHVMKLPALLQSWIYIYFLMQLYYLSKYPFNIKSVEKKLQLNQCPRLARSDNKVKNYLTNKINYFIFWPLFLYVLNVICFR